MVLELLLSPGWQPWAGKEGRRIVGDATEHKGEEGVKFLADFGCFINVCSCCFLGSGV